MGGGWYLRINYVCLIANYIKVSLFTLGGGWRGGGRYLRIRAVLVVTDNH